MFEPSTTTRTVVGGIERRAISACCFENEHLQKLKKIQGVTAGGAATTTGTLAATAATSNPATIARRFLFVFSET